MKDVPVITIDGTTGSGKGTIGIGVAAKLGWHFLDSGAIYRILALAAQEQGINANDHQKLYDLAHSLKAEFKGPLGQPAQIVYLNRDVTNEIRQEKCGIFASQIAVIPAVREALLKCQRNFKEHPGLVADGRDMGTVVFKEAILKVFLDANPHERALRRQKQLQKCGVNGNFHEILQDLIKRDERDAEREIAPLKPARDALVIDTTKLSIDEIIQQIFEQAKLKGVAIQRTENSGQKTEGGI